MAIKSTIFKANLSIADIDHAYYADHSLTLARHPSETDERMMVRLVALALNAHQIQTVCQGDGVLSFGAGLSDPNDPDVWLKDFSDQIKFWIEVGQPDEKAMTKPCGRADQVIVYAYNHAAHVWFKGVENKITRLNNLKVFYIPSEESQELAKMAARTMQLQATIQDGHLMMSDGQTSLEIHCEVWK
jgi:uncharacterized protein YaeQ